MLKRNIMYLSLDNLGSIIYTFYCTSSKYETYSTEKSDTESKTEEST